MAKIFTESSFDCIYAVVRHENEVAQKKNPEKPEKCVKKAKNRLKLKEMETILR